MHLIRKHKILILIFLLALLIRTYRLGTFPLGFHVDEAKVAWEAYSILKTGHDDHGNLLALYYNSFGDYRPTGIFYITIPSLIVFGKTIFAVRMPSALLGALTVIPIYFIALEITKNRRVSLLSSILLAIVPWDVATSRATSEVVVSAFFILTSLSLIKKRPVFSFMLLGISFFFYHSARIVGPILMLVWIGYLWNKLQSHRKVIIGFLVTSLMAIMLVLSPAGLARYDQVKLPTQNIRSVVLNYFSYFDPNFFIGDLARPFRYATANVGIVSIPIFLLFILGSCVIVKTNKNKILFLLLALGPIPAMLTLEDSPNLHRTFFMLPFLIIIAAIGFDWLWEKHRFWGKIMTFAIVIAFVTFIVNYMNTKNNFAYQYRDPQIMKVTDYIKSRQKNYDKIYVTNDPDSPYPWYAFLNDIDPFKLNTAQEKEIGGKWQFENIIWDTTKCPAANAFGSAKKSDTPIKIMVVDNGGCFADFGLTHPKAKIIKEFIDNGKINYRVWEYMPKKVD